MEIDRKELKRQAREDMRAAKPAFWQVTLVFLLMTSVVSLLLPGKSGSFDAVGLFPRILYSLYDAVVHFGFLLWGLWTARRLDPGISSLTQGFSVAGRLILLEINIYARTVLWAMLLSLGVSFLVLPILSPTMLLLAMLVVSVGTTIITLRYSLARFLLADNPDAGPGPALLRSVELMRNWKLQLFKLEFSFLGWDLINGLLGSVVLAFFMARYSLFDPTYLNSFQSMVQGVNTLMGLPALALAMLVVTLPINLWLLPYRAVARAKFYDARLQAQQADAPQL